MLLSSLKREEQHKAFFLAYKFYFLVIFVVLPIGINLIYAAVTHSWKALPSTTTQVSNVNAALAFTMILGLIQIAFFIFLVWKLPNFFIKSGAIILAFFSIFNFFAGGFISAFAISILRSIHSSWGNQILVGTTVQILFYIFLLWYIFRFCDAVKFNLILPFCVSRSRLQSSLHAKKKGTPTKLRLPTVLKKKIAEAKVMVTSQPLFDPHSKSVLPYSSAATKKEDCYDPSNLAFCWKKSLKAGAFFAILVVVFIFGFLELTNHSGGGGNTSSSSNNQNNLNSIYNSGLYGRVVFLLLVSILAPIIEEVSTRHGIIAVANYKRLNGGRIPKLLLRNINKPLQIIMLLVSMGLSCLFFANMHVMFAPYNQITSYLFIAFILVLVFVLCNFVVGYSIMVHSAFNIAVFVAGIAIK